LPPDAADPNLCGGIRSREIGSVVFGKTETVSGEFTPAKLELVRLAIDRRVYTQSHVDYVVECLGKVFQIREKIKGMLIVQGPPLLRHFTAIFEPL